MKLQNQYCTIVPNINLFTSHAARGKVVTSTIIDAYGYILKTQLLNENMHRNIAGRFAIFRARIHLLLLYISPLPKTLNMQHYIRCLRISERDIERKKHVTHLFRHRRRFRNVQQTIIEI